eukprot:scaffold247373_cov17-Prasinocladus_malaysianus.AAC.1
MPCTQQQPGTDNGPNPQARVQRCISVVAAVRYRVRHPPAANFGWLILDDSNTHTSSDYSLVRYGTVPLIAGLG